MNYLRQGDFGIFPAVICKGRNPIHQAIITWLWFHKNNEGKCHPSQKTLGEECGISNRALNYALKDLEDEGIIKRRVMKKDDNSNYNTEYELLIVNRSEQIAVGGTEQIAVRTEQFAEELYPYIYSSPSSKNITPPAAGERSKTGECSKGLDEEEIERFWKKYPRKEGKSKSVELLKKLSKKHSYQKIMAGLDFYLAKWKKEGTETKYVPMCATWLNQERFMDAPDKTESVPLKRATLPPKETKTVATLEEVDFSNI